MRLRINRRFIVITSLVSFHLYVVLEDSIFIKQINQLTIVKILLDFHNVSVRDKMKFTSYPRSSSRNQVYCVPAAPAIVHARTSIRDQARAPTLMFW